MSEFHYPLLDLFWETTLHCNAFCQFCGSRCGEGTCEELSTEEILSAFRSVADAYDARQIMINVTGGEPLLRRDLFEVMTTCTELGFSWGMVSNGMLMTPDTVKRLRDAGMKTVSISLDGLGETHETLRGVKGGFEKTVNAIRMLKEADFLEHLQVTTVVSKKNIDDLEALYVFLRTLGLDSWRVAMVDPIGRAEGQSELLLNPAEVQRYIDFISAHSADSVLSVVTSCSHYLGDHDKSLGRRRFVCRTGITVASILANGDIYVCPNVPRRPELIQGNIKSDSLPEVWEKGFRYFRDPESRQSESCKSCADWYRCKGDSTHTWNFEDKTPNFCYRSFFPAAEEDDENPMRQDDIIALLKTHFPRLSGIRMSYLQDGGKPVLFTPNASEEMFQLFRWGQYHPVNLSEQLASLIGHVFQDHILVEYVCPAYLEKRNSNQAAFSETSYLSGVEETNAINLHYESDKGKISWEPCRLLGFIHSHPAQLEVFLSEPDVALHQKLREEGHELSMIINPQKKQLAAYYGEDMELSQILLLMEEKQIKMWGLTDSSDVR